jgi:UDP-N-acetylglucosamine pyrophosphorylase
LFEAIAKNVSNVKSVIVNSDYVQIVNCENAMAKVLDPVTIGYTIHADLCATVKTCKKQENEQIGLVLTVNDNLRYLSETEVPQVIADDYSKYSHANIESYVIWSKKILDMCTIDKLTGLYSS